jgi:prepilin-type N-terminal cleavage/methylation domain-containing protein
MRTTADRQHGLTLIELLVVLAILGILVGLVASNAGGLAHTTRLRAMARERDIVCAAIGIYNAHNVASQGHPAILPRTRTTTILFQEDRPAFPYDRANPIAYENWLRKERKNGTNEQYAALFAEYLRGDTRYYYIWDEGGANVIACDTHGLDAAAVQAALANPGSPLCLAE